MWFESHEGHLFFVLSHNISDTACLLVLYIWELTRSLKVSLLFRNQTCCTAIFSIGATVISGTSFNCYRYEKDLDTVRQRLCSLIQDQNLDTSAQQTIDEIKKYPKKTFEVPFFRSKKQAGEHLSPHILSRNEIQNNNQYINQRNSAKKIRKMMVLHFSCIW